MIDRLRWLLAIIWTAAWGTARWLRNPERWSWMWGRRESPEPVHCPECGWRGPLRWAIHAYRDDGAGDVQLADECPRCEMELP